MEFLAWFDLVWFGLVVVDVDKVVVVDVDKGSGGECWPRASAFSLQSAGASRLVGTDAKISKF